MSNCQITLKNNNDFYKIKILKKSQNLKNCKNEEIEEFPKIEQFDKKRKKGGRKLFM